MPIIQFARTSQELENRGCVNIAQNWVDGQHGEGREFPALFTGLTHVGLCLEERESNGAYDSDFYMRVWDDELNVPRDICFATTRGWSYPSMSSYVDATPEIVAKYEVWKEKRRVERMARLAKIEAVTPCRGKRVRVTGGRKVPVGTEGIVFWERITERGFWDGAGNWWEPKGRIGIQLDTGEHVFVNAGQVKVIG